MALAPVARQVFWCAEAVGIIPCAGGTLTLFNAGTSVAGPVYTDSTGSILAANPIVLDATGAASPWLINQGYDVVLKDSSGVQQWKILNANPFQILTNISSLILAPQTSDPAGQGAMLIYRSDIPCLRVFTTGWDCVVRLGDAQSLTNKTLVSPVINTSVSGTAVQGTDTKLLSAGTVSASVGVTLCTDANGGATTSNCGAGVAKFDQLNNTANVNTTTLYAVPSSGAGTYRVTCFAIVTQAATTSSTLPGCSVNWTDQDTGVVIGGNVTTASTTNTVGTITPIIAAAIPGMEVKASTNITFNFIGYASVGATPMAYSVHVKLEYLGP